MYGGREPGPGWGGRGGGADAERGRERERERWREQEQRRERDGRRSGGLDRGGGGQRRERDRDYERGPGRERDREYERDQRHDMGEGRYGDRGRDRDRERDGDRARYRYGGHDLGDRGRQRNDADRRTGQGVEDELRSGRAPGRALAGAAAGWHPLSEEEILRKREKEQKDLEKDMEQRRARVLAWQAQRKEEEEWKRTGGDAAAPAEGGAGERKAWTLDDDAEDGDEGLAPKLRKHGAQPGGGHEEVDPLDAFMAAEVLPEVKKREESEAAGQASLSRPRLRQNPYASDSEAGEEEEEEDYEAWAKSVREGKGSKLDKIATVDHSKMEYAAFRRDFYVEAPAVRRMTTVDVAALRKDLEGVQARGKGVPKPVAHWDHCGLSQKVLEVIKKSGFERPTAIQAQAFPVIMSGRDCIGIAKTGSGKTLAFLLPMLRHIKDQRPLRDGDGPIALVVAPTRELVTQIGKDVRRFAKVSGIEVAAIFGGSGIADQIKALKRGVEIVVCTPGRMIDILAMGRVTNLHRVTYLVFDEADRMFDMGFEPQITRLVDLTRPDRQTVMFSATFPQKVEALARRALQRPIEVSVGGRSVVNKDIEQIVEVRPQEERFFRLLELLGQWFERGKVLVFVQSQKKCDSLFSDLIKAGYPCLSLHGGHDQSDRQGTINDFKGSVCGLMVATSVAARGLDVKDLRLVVNYDPPNHHEDYVHRVGRTGRAGNKGTAVTFIEYGEEKFAPDIVKALIESDVEVPENLRDLAEDFERRRKQGQVRAHGSGFGGSGFKFNKDEDEVKKAHRKAKVKEAGVVEISDDEGASDGEGGEAGAAVKSVTTAPAPGAAAQLPAVGPPGHVPPPHLAAQMSASQAQAASHAAAHGRNPMLAAAQLAASQATAAAAAAPFIPDSGVIGRGERHFEAELTINDFPQHARWKATHKDSLREISDRTGAAVTTRGIYIGPGQRVTGNAKKLFLLVEGPTERSVKQASAELKRILQEATEKTLAGGGGGGRYTL